MLTQFVDSVRQSNRLIAGGMFFFDSPGHMLSEADNLLRLVSHYPLIRARSPVVILPPTPMANMIGDLLKHHNIHVMIEQHALNILREIQLFHPDLILEVGQAHWKLVVPDKLKRGCGDLYPLNFGWALRADEFITQLIKWHETWGHTRGQLPLREAVMKLPVEPELLARLEANKYAVVQIKAQTGNGTATILHGSAYRPTLEMLKDLGYSIILAGREPMPEEFKRFDVYDYPRSKFVNPKNDFFLFSRAALGVVSPSGAGMFCDTLGVPCCQIGSWTLFPHPGEETIMVPSLLRRRATGKTLTFTEQAISLRDTYHPLLGPAVFDSKSLEDILPSAEEICLAVKDTLNPVAVSGEEGFPFRKKIKALDPLGMWRATASNMSPSFLTRHPEFLS